KSNKLLGGNTRSRLVLTLGLAVVLPALTLIYVNFQHVKSIQRDKKVEALIHRDFQYVLSISDKRLAQKTNAIIEHVRDHFPNDDNDEAAKRNQLDAILTTNPLFSHVFIYDVSKGEKGLIMESQPKMNDQQRKRLNEMYSGWFGLEGRTICEQTNKKAKRLTWFSEPTDTANGPSYATTAVFTFPQMPSDRLVFGGVSLDSD